MVLQTTGKSYTDAASGGFELRLMVEGHSS